MGTVLNAEDLSGSDVFVQNAPSKVLTPDDLTGDAHVEKSFPSFEEWRANKDSKSFGTKVEESLSTVPNTVASIAKGAVKAPWDLIVGAGKDIAGNLIADKRLREEGQDQAAKALTSVGTGALEGLTFIPKIGVDIGSKIDKNLIAPTFRWGMNRGDKGSMSLGQEITTAETNDQKEKYEKELAAFEAASRGEAPPEAQTTTGKAIQALGVPKEQVGSLEKSLIDPDIQMASMMVSPESWGTLGRSLAGSVTKAGVKEVGEAAAKQAERSTMFPTVRKLHEQAVLGAENLGEKIKDLRTSAGEKMGALSGALEEIPGMSTVRKAGKILSKARPIAEIAGGIKNAVLNGSERGMGALQTAAEDVSSPFAEKTLNFAGKVGGNIPINIVREIPSFTRSFGEGAAIGGLAGLADGGDIESGVSGAIQGGTMAATTRGALLPFEGRNRAYDEAKRTTQSWLSKMPEDQRNSIVNSGMTLEQMTRLADAQGVAEGVHKSVGKDVDTVFGDADAGVKAFIERNPSATPEQIQQFQSNFTQRGFTVDDAAKERPVAYVNTDRVDSAQAAFHEWLHQMFRTAPEGSEAKDAYNMAKAEMRSNVDKIYTPQEQTDKLRKYMSSFEPYNFDMRGLSNQKFDSLVAGIKSIRDKAASDIKGMPPERVQQISDAAKFQVDHLIKSENSKLSDQEVQSFRSDILNGIGLENRVNEMNTKFIDATGVLTPEGKDYVTEELLAEHARSFMNRAKGFLVPTSKSISKTPDGRDISKYFNDDGTIQIADRSYLEGIQRFLNKFGINVDRSGTPVDANGNPITHVPSDIFGSIKKSQVIDHLIADLIVRKNSIRERFALEAAGESPKEVKILPQSSIYGVDAEKVIPLAMEMGAIETKLDENGNESPVLDRQGKPIWIKPKRWTEIRDEREKTLHNAIMRAGMPNEVGALIPDPQKLKENGRLSGSFLAENQMASILADPTITQSTKRRLGKWNEILKARWTAGDKSDLRDLIVDYNKVYNKGKAGAYATETRYVSPIGVQITGQGNVNILLFDVGQFTGKLNRTLAKKPDLLAHWQGEKNLLIDDIHKLMTNWMEGRPGMGNTPESKLAPVDRVAKEKADIINALLDFGTKENISRNQFYDFVNRRATDLDMKEPGSIRTFRIERTLDIKDASEKPFFIDYQKGVTNFMPRFNGSSEALGDAARKNESAIREAVEWMRGGRRGDVSDAATEKLMDADADLGGGVTDIALARHLMGELQSPSFMPAKQSENGFYSQLEKTISELPQEKMTVGQLKAMLQKGGVKPDEMQWVMSDYLNKPDDAKITKSDALKTAQENAVQVKDVVKTEGDYAVYDGENNQYFSNRKEAEDYAREMGINVNEDTVFRATNRPNGYGSKFEKYQLPGGENYKELLLQLPNTKAERLDARRREIEELGRKATPEQKDEWASIMNELKPDNRDIENNDKFKGFPQFRAGHFSEPNVLAHVRFNERTVDGKKVLFIEEVQSDWHQKGRKEGYKGKEDTELNARIEELKKATEGRENEIFEEWKNKNSGVVPSFEEWWDSGPNQGHYGSLRNMSEKNRAGWRSQYDEVLPRLYKSAFFDSMVDGKITDGKFETLTHELRDLIKKQGTLESGVPDAPFKKTWHELAMKRMLRYAAENGFDKIAWTMGEQQGNRYDLSKHFTEIKARKNINGYIIEGKGKDGRNNFVKNEIQPEGLADVVGKELADKIIEANPNNLEGVTYSGLDLKIGGEGMKGFYDKMLPQFMDKQGKKWGAKVEQIDMPITAEADIMNGEEGGTENVKVHSMDLPKPMKSAIAEQGQPLFMPAGKAGAFTKEQIADAKKQWDEKGTASPYFQKWFAGSKIVNQNGEPEVFHHGTGNTKSIFEKGFSHEFIDKGNDQFGSGFYFTNKPDTAQGYTKSRLNPTLEKIGGEESPGVIDVYVSMKNPIVVNDQRGVAASAPKLTDKQVRKLIESAPDIKDPDGPLSNWGDVRSEGYENVLNAAIEAYKDSGFHSLANDFYVGHTQDFLKNYSKVTGKDGVVIEFPTGEKHLVAWFPEQVKSSTQNRGTFDKKSPDIKFMPGAKKVYAIQIGSYDGFAHNKTDEAKTHYTTAKDLKSAVRDILRRMNGNRNVSDSEAQEYMDRFKVKVVSVKKPDEGGQALSDVKLK